MEHHARTYPLPTSGDAASSLRRLIKAAGPVALSLEATGCPVLKVRAAAYGGGLEATFEDLAAEALEDLDYILKM